MQDPSVHFLHAGIFHQVLVKVKVVKVAEDEPAGVADAAISLYQPLEDLVGDADIDGIVFRISDEPKLIKLLSAHGISAVTQEELGIR
ncbi:MAG TPA: hypothetical protein PLR57_04905 [Clostridia bacterium]|nr:hypothetical protein [Clostridia bacterium]